MRLSGFSINRLSGVGGSGCGGNVSLLPCVSSDKPRLVKSSEQARPGFYSVTLQDGVAGLWDDGKTVSLGLNGRVEQLVIGRGSSGKYLLSH